MFNCARGCFDNLLVNLDGVANIINDDFIGILDNQYLDYINYTYYTDHNISHQKWVNRQYSVDYDNIYSWNVCSLFHIHNQTDFDILRRRVDRTKQWFEDSTQLMLFYYYRQSERYNVSKHHEKLVHFVESISAKYKKDIKCINFNSVVGDKKVDYQLLNNNVLSVTLFTPNSWIGIDDNWDAHTDNDLFYEVFNSDLYKTFTTE